MSETKDAVVEEYRRNTIQAAARRVIARRGLGRTSMAAIAEEAGVAKGTLYLYFRDRDDLLDGGLDRLAQVRRRLLGKGQEMLGVGAPPPLSFTR